MVTTPKGIKSPDPGNDYALTSDLAIMASTTDTAIENAVKGSNFYKGTASQRNAFLSQATEGDAWQDTNGTKLIYSKRGSAWVQIDNTADTGWKNIPLASGYRPYRTTSIPQFRIRDKVLYLRGTVARNSGNMPVSGQITFTRPLPGLVGKLGPDAAWNTAMCSGGTGGTLYRVYLAADATLRYGGSNRYGSGNAEYLSLGGASGHFMVE